MNIQIDLIADHFQNISLLAYSWHVHCDNVFSDSIYVILYAAILRVNINYYILYVTEISKYYLIRIIKRFSTIGRSNSTCRNTLIMAV
jgi:hypothetical protein